MNIWFHIQKKSLAIAITAKGVRSILQTLQQLMRTATMIAADNDGEVEAISRRELADLIVLGAVYNEFAISRIPPVVETGRLNA